MYKVTSDGHTMVGCNEDAWRTESKIWFENAITPEGKGAAFTGSRKVSKDTYAPQSGMNEAGLVFSRLASYHPVKNESNEGLLPIKNEVQYLSNILHSCTNVMDVKDYISEYDRSIFIDDVFLYIDSAGDYLIVEPYVLTLGNKSAYVLSNFCPSMTDKGYARNLDRYRNGEDFIAAHGIETSLSYCTALSDSMHVCRERNGDGTLLTSIWDMEAGCVNLYFYHDYTRTARLNISEELGKGDHIINIPDLFPENAEFVRLSEYITPFNTPSIRVSIVIMAAIISLLSFLCILYFIRHKNYALRTLFLSLTLLNSILVIFFFILVTDMSIFFFDAPYQHYRLVWISAFSYVPLVLLISFIAIVVFWFRHNGSYSKTSGINLLIAINSTIYLLSLMAFGYWGFFML